MYDDIDKEILFWLKEGMNSKEIGKKIFRCNRTVEKRIAKMFEGSNTKKTVSLVVFSLKHNVIDL